MYTGITRMEKTTSRSGNLEVVFSQQHKRIDPGPVGCQTAWQRGLVRIVFRIHFHVRPKFHPIASCEEATFSPTYIDLFIDVVVYVTIMRISWKSHVISPYSGLSSESRN